MTREEFLAQVQPGFSDCSCASCATFRLRLEELLEAERAKEREACAQFVAWLATVQPEIRSYAEKRTLTEIASALRRQDQIRAQAAACAEKGIDLFRGGWVNLLNTE